MTYQKFDWMSFLPIQFLHEVSIFEMNCCKNCYPKSSFSVDALTVRNLVSHYSSDRLTSIEYNLLGRNPKEKRKLLAC
jgi:hypothetical protein